MQNSSYSYRILMTLGFCGHNFEKYSTIKFYEDSSSMWTDGQTEIHDEANSHFRNFTDPTKRTYLFIVM